MELAEAKQRFQRLQDVQVQVDSTWRGSRWIMDVLSLARDRTMTGVGVAIAALSQQVTPSTTLLPTPPESSSEESSKRIVLPSKTPSTSSRLIHASTVANNDNRIIGGTPGGKHRILVKTKSDNKLLSSRNSMGESPTFLRVNTVRSRTPVCPECSVPLDLPGYVSNCVSCSCSRARYTQPGNNNKTIADIIIAFRLYIVS